MKRRSFMKSVVGILAGALAFGVKAKERFVYKGGEPGCWDGIRFLDDKSVHSVIKSIPDNDLFSEKTIRLWTEAEARHALAVRDNINRLKKLEAMC